MKQTKILFGLFVASLLIRLLAVWVVPETHLGTNAEIAYLGGAHRLVNGKGFRDPSYPVFTPPLYAVFIAGSLYLFGDERWAVKISQALADSLTVVVLYLIAEQLFGGKTALLSAIALSIYPFSIYAVTYIGSETFFTLLLSIFVLLSMYAIRDGKLRYYASAGFILGLATLTRGTTQYYPVVFLLVLFLLGKVNRATVLKYAAFCLAFALVISPWSFRNYIVLGDVIPVATAGSVFLQGSSEEFFTISGKVHEYPQYFELLRSRGIEAPSGATPAVTDRFLVRAALEKYRMRLESDPLSIVPFLLKKFARLWYATESGRNHRKILLINMLIYIPATAGLVLTWRRKITSALGIFCLVAYFVLIHWFSLPLFRYMLPVMPYVIVFGGFTIAELLVQRRACYHRDSPRS